MTTNSEKKATHLPSETAHPFTVVASKRSNQQNSDKRNKTHFKNKNKVAPTVSTEGFQRHRQNHNRHQDLLRHPHHY